AKLERYLEIERGKVREARAEHRDVSAALEKQRGEVARLREVLKRERRTHRQEERALRKVEAAARRSEAAARERLASIETSRAYRLVRRMRSLLPCACGSVDVCYALGLARAEVRLRTSDVS